MGEQVSLFLILTAIGSECVLPGFPSIGSGCSVAGLRQRKIDPIIIPMESCQRSALAKSGKIDPWGRTLRSVWKLWIVETLTDDQGTSVPCQIGTRTITDLKTP
jgi:hypothetical protein